MVIFSDGGGKSQSKFSHVILLVLYFLFFATFGPAAKLNTAYKLNA